MARPCLGLWLLAVAALHGSAAAQETPPRRARTSSLSWVRAPGAEACISTQALARMVEHHIGPVFVPPSEAELSIEGLVARREQPAGFIARIAVSDQHGEPLGSRQLRADGEDCRVLDEAAALIIALAIDREAAFAGLPESLVADFDQADDPAAALLAELEASPPEAALPEGAAAAPRPPPPARKDEPVPAPPPERAQAPASQLELEAGLSLGLLVLTERALAPEVALGHEDTPLGFPAGLRLRYWLPRELDAANGVVSMSLGQASLIACPVQLLQRQLRGCLGLWGGFFHASGSRFAQSRDALRDVWGGSVELRAKAPLGGNLALALGFALQVTFNPHSVLVPDAAGGALQEAYSAERLALLVNVGLLFAL